LPGVLKGQELASMVTIGKGTEVSHGTQAMESIV